MSRYFLELMYEGTRYSGFQVQENQQTIQSEMARALETLFRQPFFLTGSSRTDAGVHARQNFFHFDTEQPITARHIYNLNAVLPQDIAVKAIYKVADEAHCRFDALSRRYSYHIYRKKDPFRVNRGWLYPYPLNIDLLNEAAAVLMEYQDFSSFSKRNTQVKTFICQLMLSRWEEEADGLVYHVQANRFLRGMVRGLVGTMLKVGRGQTDLETFRAVISSLDCTKADFTTPPQGLFLEQVVYPEEQLNTPLQ